MQNNKGSPGAARTGRRFFVFFFCALLPAAAFAQEEELVLVRGNEWVLGIPALEINAFPAIFGRYAFRPAPREGATGASTEAELFSVWVCTEPLYFSPALWRPRPELAPYRALEKQEGEYLFLAVDIEDAFGPYTALFRFSPQKTGTSPAAVNRLILLWCARFRSFLSSAKSLADVSLPAVLK